MTMYSVNFQLGQALVEADSEDEAKAYSRAQWGECNGPYRVTEASKSDRDWVTSMGGIVHQAH